MAELSADSEKLNNVAKSRRPTRKAKEKIQVPGV